MTRPRHLASGSAAGWSRRETVRALTVAAGALPAMAASRGRVRAVSGWVPGLQLYTLGDAAAKDLDGTLRQVAAIGYRAVELPGDYGHRPDAWRRAFAAHGLHCPAIHVVPRPMPGAWDLSGDLPRLAADVRALGARRAVVSIALLPDRILDALLHPPAGGLAPDAATALFATMTADEWKRCADLLNDRARRLARSGVALAYHNHGFEFMPLATGGNGYDLLLRHTDPALVDFELDVGWAVSAGQDIDALFARAGRRIRLLHLKDAARPSSQALEMVPADVGRGIVPWRQLATLIRRHRVTDLFVEQEPPFPGERIASVKTAYDFLDHLFAEKRA